MAALPISLKGPHFIEPPCNGIDEALLFKSCSINMHELLSLHQVTGMLMGLSLFCRCGCPDRVP
jgi:hypothetical protein